MATNSCYTYSVGFQNVCAAGGELHPQLWWPLSSLSSFFQCWALSLPGQVFKRGLFHPQSHSLLDVSPGLCLSWQRRSLYRLELLWLFSILLSFFIFMVNSFTSFLKHRHCNCFTHLINRLEVQPVEYIRPPSDFFPEVIDFFCCLSTQGNVPRSLLCYSNQSFKI